MVAHEVLSGGGGTSKRATSSFARSELRPEELRRAVAVLRQAYRPDGFNVGMNLGQVAGAQAGVANAKAGIAAIREPAYVIGEVIACKGRRNRRVVWA